MAQNRTLITRYMHFFMMGKIAEIRAVVLQLARDNLDRIKDEFNDAHYAFYEYIDSEEERRPAYQWFDVQDRVAIELRTQLVDKIYSVERKAEEQKPKSVFSGSSKRSKRSNTSGGSARSRRLEAAARKAKLEVEKQFLEQEHEMRKLQILKEISIAEAEENVMKRILNEESEMNTNGLASRKPLIDPDDKDNDKDNKIKDESEMRSKAKMSKQKLRIN